MAYDQWTGARIMPELLATFVTPNHPILSRISVKASQFLEKWTGNFDMVPVNLIVVQKFAEIA